MKRTTTTNLVFVIGLAALGCSLQLIAQGNAPPPVVEGGPQEETIFTLLLKGGPIMIPLGICSIVALTVSLERLIFLRKNNILPVDFFKQTRRIVEEARESGTKMDKIREFCEKRSSAPFARIMAAGVKKWNFDKRKEEVEKTIEDFGSREVERMHRSLRTLKIIAAVSPLLGLLGTVFGMIRAFQTVALSTDSFGKAEKLAHGIYEAMVTTATGLSIAIPTLLIFYFLSNRVDAFADDIEVSSDMFMSEFMEFQKNA